MYLFTRIKEDTRWFSTISIPIHTDDTIFFKALCLNSRTKYFQVFIKYLFNDSIVFLFYSFIFREILQLFRLINFFQNNRYENTKQYNIHDIKKCKPYVNVYINNYSNETQLF